MQLIDYSTRYEMELHCEEETVYLQGDDHSQHSKNAPDAMLSQEHSDNYPKLVAHSPDRQISTISSPT